MAEKTVAKKRGCMINFTAAKDITLGEVFGTKPVPMTKLMGKVWDIIRAKNLKV